MQKNLLRTLIALCLLVTLTLWACTPKKPLKNGIWRATLRTKCGTEIPFNFIIRDTAGKKQVCIINGDSRFEITDIAIKNDSLIMLMPFFNSEIKARLKGGALLGKWVKNHEGKELSMAFKAEPDIQWRFFESTKPTKFQVEGRWSVLITNEASKDTTLGVAELKQLGPKITANFFTTKGHFHFLEGSVVDNRLFLSCFDGENAYLFTGLLSDGTISYGKLYLGADSVKSWSAKRDGNAMLPEKNL